MKVGDSIMPVIALEKQRAGENMDVEDSDLDNPDLTPNSDSP